MTRITIKDLKAACVALNRELGRPQTYCDTKPGEPFKANLGHFHIDQAYGGYQVAETTTDGGGIRTYGGHVPARQCYDRLWAMVDGVRLARS